MQTNYDAVIPAPFGAIGIQAQDDFLTRLDLLPQTLSLKAAAHPFVQTVVAQLQGYLLDARAPLSVPFAIKGTLFQKRVWQAIAAVPPGKTITYSELAQQVHSGPRAVANVCGANQVPLFIPCHRVVAKAGLGGFMQGNQQGLLIKQWLLTHESGT